MIDQVIRGTALVLIVLLSVALYRAKVDNASLRGEISRNTRPFVIGAPLPELPVRNETGTALELRDLCGGRSTVVVFSSDACESCALLKPEWLELARRSADHKVVVVNPGESVEEASSEMDESNVTRVAAPPGDIIRALGFSEVPTLVLADASCRILAAGVGPASSRSLLSMIADERTL